MWKWPDLRRNYCVSEQPQFEGNILKNPNFFLLGAPKSGTTALAQYLSEHPNVFVTDPKEPHFYSKDLNHGLYRDRDRYLALFEAAGHNHRVVGEASVWYLYSDVAITNILTEYPTAKFIVMLRNPIEMAISLHDQMVYTGYETERNFEKAWELQALRKRGEKIPVWCHEPKLLQYKSDCLIGEQFARISAAIPKGNLLSIMYDDFKDSPEVVWEKILAFLSLEADGREAFPIVNAAKARRSFILKRVNDAYCRLREALGLRGLGTGIFAKLNNWNHVGRSRKLLNPVLAAKLKAEFFDDISKLERTLDRDLSGWLDK